MSLQNVIKFTTRLNASVLGNLSLTSQQLEKGILSPFSIYLKKQFGKDRVDFLLMLTTLQSLCDVKYQRKSQEKGKKQDNRHTHKNRTKIYLKHKQSINFTFKLDCTYIHIHTRIS